MRYKKIFIGLCVLLMLGGGVVLATKWSDYGSLTSGKINNVDDFLVRDVSDTSLGATGTQKKYTWTTLKADLGSAGFYDAAGDESDPNVDTESEIEAITGTLFGASKAVTSGYLWVADGTDFESVVISGDIAIIADGTTTIQANAVDSADYIDGSIDHEHLAADVINGMVNVTSADADYILIWDNTDSSLKKCDMGEVRGTGGGGSGTLNAIKENDVQVGGADIVTLDFLGADFDLTESPNTEIQVVIAAALMRDAEWTTSTTSAEGKVELATNAETVTGTDTGRVVTPDGLTDKIAAPGSIGVTTPGSGAFTSLTTTGSVTIGSGGDTADAGTIRLENADSIQFEASPAGTDVNALSVDSSEIVQIAASGASGVTITPALTCSSSISATTGTFTGTLSGELGVTLDTTATIDLSTASNARGAMRINNDNDVIDYTLPPAEAGLSICFYSRYAAVVTVDTDGTGDLIILDGAALAAGYAIDSAGAAGDFICLACMDATRWISLGRSGTWIDGGAD